MKAKYYAIYAVRINGGLQRIKGRKFRPSETSLTFDEDTFIVDIANPIYRTIRGKYMFLFEKNKGQVTLSDTTLLVNQKIIKALFKQELPRQLVAGLNDAMSVTADKLMFLLAGIMGGVGIGWILCSILG
jgi:hypothetical protein